jgi:hypothetical protein
MSCAETPLKQRHTRVDFLFYKLVTLVPFAAALMAIAKHSLVWSASYLLWILFHVLVIYRLLCTHCPHYGADDGKTSCHFIWKTPAFYRKRPGAMGAMSQIGLVVMLAVSSLAPMPWLLRELDLLVLYLLSLGVLFATMMKYECTRCANLDCPKNQVPEEVRQRLLEVDSLESGTEAVAGGP